MISELLMAPRHSRVALSSLQMSTTFTGMAPKEKEGVRAAANLPLWKNVLFSAIGGVVGACTQRSVPGICRRLRSPAADNSKNSRGCLPVSSHLVRSNSVHAQPALASRACRLVFDSFLRFHGPGATAVYPLDIAKTQLQMDKAGKFTGLFNALNVIKSEGGMGALYRWAKILCGRERACDRVHCL